MRSYPLAGRRARRAVALVAIAMVGISMPAVTSAGAARPTAKPVAVLAVPHLTWIKCGGRMQCARARVPLDYDQPLGPSISLALIRLPATDQAHKIGSIFLNPGGPGGSGVDAVRESGPYLFSPQVRARFDIVGFDPRGIIRSTPLRCFDTIDQAFGTVAPFPFPVTMRQQRVWLHSDRALAAACAKHGGPIMDHMATADAARDLDLLRRAVGDAKLTYYGVSYGTYLGETYASLFPGKVRALVIDGVINPVAWSTGRNGQSRTLPFSTRLLSAQGAYASLGQFFTLCHRGAANCAFSDGSPRARYAALAHRLRLHPIRIDDGGGTETFTYADLVSLTLGSLYDPLSWPSLADVLQQLDTTPHAAAHAIHTLRVRLGAATQQRYPNFLEGFPGVACSDSDNPNAPAAWGRAAAAADRAHPYFGRIWTWVSSICQPWPGRDTDRYLGPFTERTANPVLVIGNRYDPATRYQGAVKASQLLPGSRLLTLNGWGHTSLFESKCIDWHLDHYLLTRQLPAVGTVCRPNVVPFAHAAGFALRASGRSASALVIPPFIRWMMAR
jgi:pimeloyl-ACP methyl ester carboxylesterase